VRRNRRRTTAVTANAPVARYAIELDTDRAEACAAAGITTIHGNTIEVAGKVQQVSCSTSIRPTTSRQAPRTTNAWSRCFSNTATVACPRGILVFVIPEKALAYCSRTLAGRFADIRVYHLTHPDSVKYDQVVLFGVRKDQTDRAAERNQTFLNGLSWGASASTRCRNRRRPLDIYRAGLWAAAFTHRH